MSALGLTDPERVAADELYRAATVFCAERAPLVLPHSGRLCANCHTPIDRPFDPTASTRTCTTCDMRRALEAWKALVEETPEPERG